MPRFLPSLSSLITVNDLPQNLGILQDVVNTIFDDIYYDHYQEIVSARGESKTYNLDIVINKHLGFSIPGADVSLLLNPNDDLNQPQSSSFNITLNYRLGILKFINSFDLTSFSFNSNDLIKLFLKIFDINEATILEYISIQIKNPDGVALGYLVFNEDELVRFFNDFYGLIGTANELIYSGSTTFQNIATGLDAAGIPMTQVISDFAIDTDYPGGSDTVEDVFSRLNVIRDSGPLSISELVNELNNQYSLTGTVNEIIYVVSPETTYGDILSALTIANITVIQLILDYVISANGTFNETEQLLTDFFIEAKQTSYGQDYYNLLKPSIRASVNDLTFAIEFPRTVLIPIDPNSSTNEPLLDPAKSKLKFTVGNLIFSSEDGFYFEGEDNISFQKSQIGNTGLIIEFTGMKLDLSRTSNIPEATADGRPNDFIGVYIQTANVYLPQKWFKDTNPVSTGPSLIGTNLLIGTGGISGKIGFDSAGILKKKLGLFEIELDEFDITFHQNAIKDSHIHGKVKINGFKDGSGADAKIEVDIGIESNGDFHVVAADVAGIPILQLPGILRINLTELALGRVNDKFYVEVAGTLDFLVKILDENILPTGINIKRLRIWDNGEMEFEGGVSILPQPKTVTLGPVKLTISALTLGKATINGYGYSVFGFDGGVNVNPGGVDVRASGVQLYIRNDGGDFFVRIQGISIDIMIPGTASKETAAVLLKGYLSVSQPHGPASGTSIAETEYAGAISFELPKLHMAGSAAMRLNPDKPSFIVDLGLEISTPILLGTTGLGIYGFRGLVGSHYTTNKSDNDSWFQYYKAPKKYQLDPGKFVDEDGFSLGAGVSLATAGDSGKVFSSRLFFLISLPNVIIFEGQAAILRQRIGLDYPDEPPFYAFIALTDHSVEAAFGVNYLLPENSGAIAEIHAQLELGFFFGNSTAWYLNIGRDTPVERRVSVRLFRLFNAYFYMMISNSQIRAGAGASWRFKKNYGPVGVDLGADLDTSGQISFIHPRQIGGSIAVGGHVKVKVFCFKFGFGVGAGLAAEAPTPFIITGYFYIEIGLPWPFDDIEVKVELTWVFNNDHTPVQIDLMEQGSQHGSAKALNIMTKEPFKLLAGSASSVNLIPNSGWFDNDDYTIPLDSYIDMEFTRPVSPMGNRASLQHIGGAASMSLQHSEQVPPIQAVQSQLTHNFNVIDVRILCLDPDPVTHILKWVDYNMYAALTPYQQVYQVPLSTFQNLKYGFWQIQESNRINKLRILSQDPFSYMTQGISGGLTPEELGILGSDIFCPPKQIPSTCVNFDYESVPPFSAFQTREVSRYKSLWFIVYPYTARLVSRSAFSHGHAVEIVNQNSLEIILPVECGKVCLKLTSRTQTVNVSYYKRKQNGTTISGVPSFTWALVETKVLNQGDLSSPVCFETPLPDALPDPLPDSLPNPPADDDQVFQRIVITPGGVCENIQYNNIACDSEVTSQMLQFRLFLVALVENNCLTQSFGLYPEKDLIFSGVYQYTTLYSESLIKGDTLTYQVNQSVGNLDITIIDNRGFTCGFHIDGLNSDFNFNRVTQVISISPDSSSPHIGLNYGYVVEVQLSDGSTVQLHGTSCYPVVSCEGSYDVVCDNELSDEGKQLIKFFQVLIRLGLLAQTTKLYPDMNSVFNGVYENTVLYNSPLSEGDSLIYDVKDYEGDLYASVYDNHGFKCCFHLLGPAADFDFKTIVEVISIEPVISSPPAGGLGSFTPKDEPTPCNPPTDDEYIFKLVVKLDNGTTIDIYGSSCYPIANCYENICAAYLFEICYLSRMDQLQNNSNAINAPNLSLDLNSITTTINNNVIPIWRPNTKYAIYICAEDRVSSGSPYSPYQYYYYCFQTKGPIGHFHNVNGNIRPDYLALESANRESEFKLARLQHYIDFKKSYPNADGDVMNAKPIFYANPRLRLFFLQPYMYAMFGNWGALSNNPGIPNCRMKVMVIDPADLTDNGQEIQWVPDVPMTVTQNISALNNYNSENLSRPPCVTMTPLTPNGTAAAVNLSLKPLKLYTAIFENIFNDVNHEVHRYTFQTSRYQNFEEQIGSYVLAADHLGNPTKIAKYVIEKEFNSAQYALVSKILNNSLTATADQIFNLYQTNYERMVDGALRLGALEPAQTTDFIVIKDAMDHHVIGVIVRNLEPFNHPSIPENMPTGSAGNINTISAHGILNGQTQFEPLKIYLSKDKSKAYITGNSPNLHSDHIVVTFNYYEIKDSGVDYTKQSISVNIQL